MYSEICEIMTLWLVPNIFQSYLHPDTRKRLTKEHFYITSNSRKNGGGGWSWGDAPFPSTDQRGAGVCLWAGQVAHVTSREGELGGWGGFVGRHAQPHLTHLKHKLALVQQALAKTWVMACRAHLQTHAHQVSKSHG